MAWKNLAAEHRRATWKQGTFIRISAITNILVWGALVGQYLYYILASGALFIAVLGEFFVACIGLLLSYVTLVFSRENSLFLRILATSLQLVFLLVYAFLVAFINGPFTTPLLVVEVGLAALNFLAFIDHLAGNRRIITGQCRLGKLWPTRRAKAAPAIAVAVVVALGVASFNSFWATIQIRAPDGATTTSSFWGGPNLYTTTWSADVLPVDNWTLHVAPADLLSPPASYGNGSLAYVVHVYQGGNLTKDYMNYTDGARSYPNGTVVLADPLPSTAAVVNVTFAYVQNWQLLQTLGDTNATVIVNWFGSYIDEPNPFHRIRDTYFCQLFDHWRVKFYIQVDAFSEFSNAFNYLNVTPLANRTLDWGVQWQQFRGVSFDCEQESYPMHAGSRPGSPPLFPGTLIPESWGSWRQMWYWMNNVNETLFARARAAYEGVYRHALDLGKEVEIVLGPSDLSEYVDGDEDYHSNPAMPFTAMPNVRYSQMSYHDNDQNGQFALYRDCVESIHQLGGRGSSILTGWVNDEAMYYTPDEAGFQHYVDDCLVAQAAGMTEIFHAPLPSIQDIWGDDAILQLHDALNNAEKRTITIKIVQFTNFFLWDFWKNFNKPAFLFFVLCAFACGILVEVRSRKNPRKNPLGDEGRRVDHG